MESHQPERALLRPYEHSVVPGRSTTSIQRDSLESPEPVPIPLTPSAEPRVDPVESHIPSGTCSICASLIEFTHLVLYIFPHRIGRGNNPKPSSSTRTQSLINCTRRCINNTPPPAQCRTKKSREKEPGDDAAIPLPDGDQP